MADSVYDGIYTGIPPHLILPGDRVAQGYMVARIKNPVKIDRQPEDVYLERLEYERYEYIVEFCDGDKYHVVNPELHLAYLRWLDQQHDLT